MVDKTQDNPQRFNAYELNKLGNDLYTLKEWNSEQVVTQGGEKLAYGRFFAISPNRGIMPESEIEDLLIISEDDSSEE